jgi:hypothetical protein
MSEAAPSTTPLTADPVAALVAPVETFSAAYVKELRDEAAKYRTEKNDAVEAAKAALSTEFELKLTEAGTQYAELGATASARELELTKLKAIIAADIPTNRIGEVAELVVGTTEAEITDRVKTLKDLMGDGVPARIPATDPSQGGTGKQDIPLNGDPILQKLMDVIGK